MSAELAEELKRREIVEVDTREAQAALGVAAEGRREDQARVARLEMNNLSLMVCRMESERNDLVSTLFQGAPGGQLF